ncbi:TnsA-like heteromeric transposase endonuclease subunit [Nocardia sp. CA2R105]|uniref:TnsA-like heteromeric transposase endonuclease subunit n=1 Tax=Nocardia coffeae TaxID=2873381 RepID=UPI001CA77D7D|nr:TnsA-like heteromeric transposase endonuclease subunit [Nocardia coffeae]MBY8857999.1 TnsA-like heteromeric transposase endonuclease subunit [Nocardia coffeae]
MSDSATEYLVLGDWPDRWSATHRRGSTEIVTPVRELAALVLSGCQPVRRFSWHRSQRHRSGLHYMVSTGRHHGFESLAEARLLMMLDFAGGIDDVLSQPIRLRFETKSGAAEHIPDFLADTVTGRWLIDVRPAGRIKLTDEIAFAATAQVAGMLGWGYAVVTGGRQPAMVTVDTLSSQRRPLADPLDMAHTMRSIAAKGSVTFGELAEMAEVPVMARSILLQLLWRRQLGMDLAESLGDRTVIAAPVGSSRRVG